MDYGCNHCHIFCDNAQNHVLTTVFMASNGYPWRFYAGGFIFTHTVSHIHPNL
jgi:hypothetical protein